MGRTLLELSLQGGAAVLLVLLFRAAALHRAPKRVFPALWGLVCLCLLCPLRLAVEVPGLPGPPTILSPASAAPLDAAAPAGGPISLPAEPSAAPERGWDAGELLPVLWAVGAAGTAGWFLTAHFYYRRKYRAAVRVEDGPVRAFLAAHPLGRQMAVKRTAQVTSPLTYGLFRPVILLPRDFPQEGEALSFVLAHELAHIKRWDVARKWVLALAVSVHWFNPLVWLMYVLANRDIELACDEAVTCSMERQEKAAYPMSLLALAERRSGAAPLGTGFGKKAVKERVMTMLKAKKITAWGKAAAVAAVVLVMAAGLLTVGVAAEAPPAEPTPVQTAAPTPTPVQEALHIPTEEWILEHGYPTNDLGETYGPDVSDDIPSPDLTLAYNYEEGIRGYVRQSELDAGCPQTLEEAANWKQQRFYVNLYLQDGKTVIGRFKVGGGTSTPEPSASPEDTGPLDITVDVRTHPITGEKFYRWQAEQQEALHIPTQEWVLEHGYPTNDLGETYGPNVKELDHGPDLILAIDRQGLQGYLRWSEFPGTSIRTPEEAIAYCSEDHSPCYLNLYLQDGVTVIGTFRVF